MYTSKTTRLVDIGSGQVAAMHFGNTSFSFSTFFLLLLIHKNEFQIIWETIYFGLIVFKTQ